MVESITVEIVDFVFFGFDTDLGVDLFGVDALAFIFDLDLAFAIREEGGVNVWVIFIYLLMVMV